MQNGKEWKITNGMENNEWWSKKKNEYHFIINCEVLGPKSDLGDSKVNSQWNRCAEQYS